MHRCALRHGLFGCPLGDILARVDGLIGYDDTTRADGRADEGNHFRIEALVDRCVVIPGGETAGKVAQHEPSVVEREDARARPAVSHRRLLRITTRNMHFCAWRGSIEIDL